MMNGPARATFVIAATALVLRSGGMVACADSTEMLRCALEDFPIAAPGDEIGPAHGRARELIAARRSGDETAYSEAKFALKLEMSAHWQLRARAYARGSAS